MNTAAVRAAGPCAPGCPAFGAKRKPSEQQSLLPPEGLQPNILEHRFPEGTGGTQTAPAPRDQDMGVLSQACDQGHTNFRIHVYKKNVFNIFIIIFENSFSLFWPLLSFFFLCLFCLISITFVKRMLFKNLIHPLMKCLEIMIFTVDTFLHFDYYLRVSQRHEYLINSV